jgi:hypothetical protein
MSQAVRRSLLNDLPFLVARGSLDLGHSASGCFAQAADENWSNSMLVRSYRIRIMLCTYWVNILAILV